MKILAMLLLPLLMISCGLNDANQLSYTVDRTGYRKLQPESAKIEISLWDQKAWLLDEAHQPVLVTDIATGVPGKETPRGEFTILERQKSKRSNRYGRLVDQETREVVIEKAWEHKGPIPEGSEYEGIAMPYWMRLTWYGVGIHVGQFKKRTRSSFGCIRVYEKAQPKIFEKTQLGTPVKIVSESLMEKYSLR